MVTSVVEVFDRDGTAHGEIVATLAATVELGELAPTGKLTVYSDRDLFDGQLVRCRYGNTETAWMVDGEEETPFIRDGWRVAAPRVYTVVGAAGLLARGTVDAEGGMFEGAAQLRPWGPARADYDASGWVQVTTAGTKSDPAFGRDPSHPEGWALTDQAAYIHPVSDGDGGTAPGRGLVRVVGNLAVDAEITCQLTVDDELPDLWFAGHQPVAPITGLYQWKRTTTFSEVVKAGPFAIFAVINNLERPIASSNIAHLLLAAVDEFGNEVAVTGQDWQAWPVYPTVIMPGESAGVIADVVLNEPQASARQSIPDTLSVGFTLAADSAGVDWIHETALPFEVRQDTALTAMVKLMRLCAIEHGAMAITDTGPRFDLWQTFGVDLSVGESPQRWEAGGEIIDARRARIPPDPNDVWTLTQAGWIHAVDDESIAQFGRIEGGVTVGVAAVPEAMGVATDTAVEGQTEPRRYRYEIIDNGRRAWAGESGWWLGSTVLADRPGDVGPVRVLKITFDTSNDPVRWSTVVEPVVDS